MPKRNKEKNRTERRKKALKNRSKDKKISLEAKRRHAFETSRQLKEASTMESPIKDKSQAGKIRERKLNAKNVLDPRIVLKKTNLSAKLLGGSKAAQDLLKLANNRWLRRGVIGIGLSIASSYIYRSIATVSERVLMPKYYDNSNLQDEYMTDFGSPLKLWKTAAKTITPYKSSVRRGIRTNTRQVTESNLALHLASNAIGHMRY